MGLIRALLGPLAEQGPSPWDDFWFRAPGEVLASPAGVRVTADSVLTHSVAWACGRVIASTIASLPLILYERQSDGGKQRALRHPLYDLLHDAPNEEQDAFQFVELLTLAALFRGTGYARIVPGPRGPVDQLIPIHPDCIRPDPAIGPPRRYLVRLDPRGGREETLLPDEVFRLVGLSLDGYRGLSVIEYARRTLGHAIALEEYGARFFGSGARPGGVLRVKGELSLEAARRLKAEWEQAHGGIAAAHRVAVLEEGTEWQQISISNEDSQFLETRAFSVEEVSRWFGVPLFLLNHTEKSTSWGTGIEQLGLAFLTYTLMPWLKRWERAIGRQLVLAPNRYFAEFLVDALLRGTTRDRYEAYAIGLQNGFLRINEVRSLENLNPLEHGDATLQPLNMQRLGEERAALERFVRDAAARVVRRELAALGRVARRTPGDPNGWAAAVREFYASHADYVAESLHLRPSAASAYARAREAFALERGWEGLQLASEEAAAQLAELALAEALAAGRLGDATA